MSETRAPSLAQRAPGPLAAQLAIYLGWVQVRVLGATLVAVVVRGRPASRVASVVPWPVVLVSGLHGPATAATLGVFLPCYLFVIIPAPYFRRIAKNRSINAFVQGMTTAATGARRLYSAAARSSTGRPPRSRS